ncbi:MAG: carboxypeptidase regulatory-like domain-containing protein [Anaerolineae bacterium]
MRKQLVAITLCLVIPLTLSGCGAGPLLSNVKVRPASISPNADGVDDVAAIEYTVGRNSRLSVSFVAPDGTQRTFRDQKRRTPGGYTALFGGSIEGRVLADGTYTIVVEASDPNTGETQREERQLTITGGDTTLPNLDNFTVFPEEFTPNQDGIGDRIAISYHLAKPADVRVWIEDSNGAFVDSPLEEQESIIAPGEPGYHRYDYDAGVDADAPPPPDGDYRVVAEARDAAGNVVRVEHPLVIQHSGQPRADILGDVIFDKDVVVVGDTLTFTTTIKNIGRVPLRTFGPEPGASYDNTTSFNSLPAVDTFTIIVEAAGYERALRVVSVETGRILTEDFPLMPASSVGAPAEAQPSITALPAVDADKTTICGQVSGADGQPISGATVYVFESDGDGILKAISDADGRYCLANVRPGRRDFSRRSGAVRLGLEYDEKLTDLPYPYRWQIGRTEELAVCESENVIYLCLPPQQQVVVTGQIRIVEPPYRRNSNFYVALLHEDVRRMVGPYGIKNITIEY